MNNIYVHAIWGVDKKTHKKRISESEKNTSMRMSKFSLLRSTNSGRNRKKITAIFIKLV